MMIELKLYFTPKEIDTMCKLYETPEQYIHRAVEEKMSGTMHSSADEVEEYCKSNEI